MASRVKKIMKITIKISFLLILVILTLVRCVTFRKSDKSTLKQFKKETLIPIVVNDTIQGKQLRYVHLKSEKNLPTIIFVHGTPGSSNDFLNYLKDTSLNKYYNLISIDRLGYGYSEYGNYNGIKEQAEVLKALVDKINLKETYLVGHSFGGPIVAHASLIIDLKGTVMIAPALDPENEKYFWFTKLAYWKGTRWLTSKALRVSAIEKYKHAQELKELESGWANINSPILHIHGTKDILVPFINLQYSINHFPKEFLTTSIWEKEGHLIPFTEKERMMKEIKAFVGRKK